MSGGVPSDEVRRRMENKEKFWQQRMAAITSDAGLALACFDRARAAARMAERGGNKRAMHDLAMLLTTWARQHEADEIRRHTA